MPQLNLLPETRTIRYWRGDDRVIEFAFWEDEAETIPLDLSDYTGFALTIKAPDGTLATATFPNNDLPNGLVRARIDGESVRPFPKRGCQYDAAFVDPDGDDLTFAEGPFLLRGDVGQ